MADVIMSIIGSLDNVPADLQNEVVTACCVLVPVFTIAAIDLLKEIFSRCFGR